MTSQNQAKEKIQKENNESQENQGHKYFYCIKPGCNANIERLNTSKQTNYDIVYFKCKKCNDLSYFLYVGDTYDREVFTLNDYQNFLTRVDDNITAIKDRESDLDEREKLIRHREKKLEEMSGFKGLLRRIFT